VIDPNLSQEGSKQRRKFIPHQITSSWPHHSQPKIISQKEPNQHFPHRCPYTYNFLAIYDFSKRQTRRTIQKISRLERARKVVPKIIKWSIVGEKPNASGKRQEAYSMCDFLPLRRTIRTIIIYILLFLAAYIHSKLHLAVLATIVAGKCIWLKW
jgi:hypothetical protein